MCLPPSDVTSPDPHSRSPASVPKATPRWTEGPQRHSNKFYDLTGPEPQSMDEIAAVLAVTEPLLTVTEPLLTVTDRYSLIWQVLGAALGKKLEYRPQDFAQFEKDFGPTRAAFFE